MTAAEAVIVVLQIVLPLVLIDLVAVGRWGSRDSGIFPRDPAGYAVFGDTVRAPCAGTVVRATEAENRDGSVGEGRS